MTTTEDEPTPDEALRMAVRDMIQGRVAPRDLLEAIPTGDLRAYVAELDGEEPPESFTAAEIIANLPDDVVGRYARDHKLTQPVDLAEIIALLPISENRVTLRAAQIREERAARALVEAEERGVAELPRMVSLGDFLAEPDEDVAYRVEGLWPRDGRIMLTAPMKAGKTTMIGNLLRSLVDGLPFLGQFKTEPVQRVLLLDDEMSEGQLRRWLRDHGIKAASAISLVSLRGHLSSFNILDPATRTQWAEFLGAADVLVFDCLRPALDALRLNEHTEIGIFLEAFDELIAEAGIRELLVVHHMGHGAERARGDSRAGDWPDANWKIVLAQKADGVPDEHGARFFSAMGRDVEQHEAQLGYDHTDRRLSIEGGSRAQAALTNAEQTVLDCLREAEGSPSGTTLESMAAAAGITQADYRRARARLVMDGRVVEQPRPGRGGGKQYSLPPEERDEL